MIAMLLSEIAKNINGELFGNNIEVAEVFTDSRIENPNGLFVALKGPHFDAHNFVSEIENAGASAVVVERKFDIEIPQIVVSNTRIALAEIARLNRKNSKARYIAITGSSGKTTVKEMIASILNQFAETFATRGNLNNDIGVPLTLLQINNSIEYGVVELGANHAGEVAFTADITQPDVALVNNVTAAHLQGFGDIQGVARAKAEIYSALPNNGIAIINADDDFSEFFKSKVKDNFISFSVKNSSDVFATDIQINSDQSTSFILNYKAKKTPVTLPLVGLHNVSNALAAAACCIALDISLEKIASGLHETPRVEGRLIVNDLANGCRVIDDSYNANLASMIAAIDLLKNYPAPRILVLGDMAELGELGRQYHEQIGEYAKQSNIEKLFSYGVLTQFSQLAFEKVDPNANEHSATAFKTNTHFSKQSDLIIKLKKEAKDGVTILVKGSRSAHMENVVHALIENSQENENLSQGNSVIDKRTASLTGDY